MSSWFSDEFVTMFRVKTGYPIVEPAHMVFSSSFAPFNLLFLKN